MPHLIAPSTVRDAPGPRIAATLPDRLPPPDWPAPSDPLASPPAVPADDTPPTPDVGVLIVLDDVLEPVLPAGPDASAGADASAGRIAPGALPPEVLATALSGALAEAPTGSPAGSESLAWDVLALVRACTGRAPALCRAEDVTGAAVEFMGTAGALLLLGSAEALADAPADDRLSVLALETLAAPDGADRLVAALLSAQHPPRARIVAVVGARGGLGASTFLLHLARACAAAGARVALLDADPAGGLGLLIGDDVVPGLRWGDLPADEAAFRPDRLVPVLPTWLGMPILTGDGRGGAPGPTAVGPALEALRAHHDLVIVDLPRGAALPPGCLALFVTGLDLRSAVAAEALIARAGPTGDGSQALIVRSIGEDVTADDLEAMTGAPVVATIPNDRAVTQRVARGDDPTRGRGSTRRAARAVASGLLEADRPW
ncbi:cobalamin biosynthesis protein CobQ [Actinomyces gerencseriae]|uniref:nucleotide-binding protein n=1 Tax=Actinomyces gerencseriae TaxID=52769 RepID=UPI001FDF21AA|nr:cobalamin biosynthesis protein CobQ [Actinomyces gerencseriae]